MDNNIKDKVIMSEVNTTLQTISSVSKEFEVFKTEIYKTQERYFLLNNIYHSPDDVRVIFSEIIGQNIGSDFSLLPPFYCDYGKNIVIGKNVFVNMGCTFMDLGGIILDDNVMFAPSEKRGRIYENEKKGYLTLEKTINMTQGNPMKLLVRLKSLLLVWECEYNIVWKKLNLKEIH